MSRTRDEPTPTYISLNSEPDVDMKDAFASAAVAFANNVLPVPKKSVKTEINRFFGFEFLMDFYYEI